MTISVGFSGVDNADDLAGEIVEAAFFKRRIDDRVGGLVAIIFDQVGDFGWGKCVVNAVGGEHENITCFDDFLAVIDLKILVDAEGA